MVANRNHEGDGLMAALCNQMVSSPYLSTPYQVDWPRTPKDPPNDSGKPRCLVDIRPNQSDELASATMEIWCIDDLVNTKGDSKAKEDAMDKITNYGKAPDGVVAFGTAAYPDVVSNDGCAAIGGTIFIHDASNDAIGPHGNWAWAGNMEKLIPTKTPASFFTDLAADQTTLDAIRTEMIPPINHSAEVLQLLISGDAVGISSVNIPKGAAYCDIDTGAVALARAAGATTITSVETTHGVIRSKWPNAPFIYVTAIPNRICHFPDEAMGKYAQEFPSSHNAGIALKHAIAPFVKSISS